MKKPLIIYLSFLVTASAFAFYAGWTYCERDMLQGRMNDRITGIEAELLITRGRVDNHGERINNHADSLLILQRCANSAGWLKVKRIQEKRIQNNRIQNKQIQGEQIQGERAQQTGGE